MEPAVSSADLLSHIEATVKDTIETELPWEIEEHEGEMVITIKDETLIIHKKEGPQNTVRWSLSRVIDGETIGKFGLFETVDELTEQLSIVLLSDVRYTVCCDG